MCGPLSLVNHACKSTLVFTAPQQMKKEEFYGLQVVYCKPLVDFVCKKEEELCVNYFPNHKYHNTVNFE